MKYRYAIGVAALSLCLGAAVAQAQYYYYLPEGAGPIFRLGVGPSFFQNGRLTSNTAPRSGFQPGGLRYGFGLRCGLRLGLQQIYGLGF